MPIGGDANFLAIEATPLEGGYPAFRVQVVASDSRGRFTASRDRLILDTSVETVRRFSEFESFKSETMQIPISEGGWFVLHRDSRGYISVRYRFVGWKVSAAFEGEIVVEGEFAGNVCREFGRLLKGQA